MTLRNHQLLLLLTLFIPMVSWAGPTYLDGNTLIFGNGGGFKDTNEYITTLPADDPSFLGGFGKAIKITGGDFYSTTIDEIGNEFIVTAPFNVTFNQTATTTRNEQWHVMFGQKDTTYLLMTVTKNRGSIVAGSKSPPVEIGGTNQHQLTKLTLQKKEGWTWMGGTTGASPSPSMVIESHSNRVGIGISRPGFALHVSGNLTLINNAGLIGKIGVSGSADSSTGAYSSSSEVKVASVPVSFKGIPHAVVIIGTISLSKHTSHENAESYIKIIDTFTNEVVAISSITKFEFEGGFNAKANLAPVYAGVLNINHPSDGVTAEYIAELYIKRADKLANELASITFFALPDQDSSGEIAGFASNPPFSGNPLTPSNFSPDHTYIAKDTIAFHKDAGTPGATKIAASPGKIKFLGSKKPYKNLKAYDIQANKLYKIKPFLGKDNITGAGYLMRIGKSTDPVSMGIGLHAPTVNSSNFQVLPAPHYKELWLNSFTFGNTVISAPVQFGDTAMLLNANGIGIGGNPNTSTNILIDLVEDPADPASGRLAYTGFWQGTFARVATASVIGTPTTASTTWAAISGLEAEVILPPTYPKWNIIAYSFISTWIKKDDASENYKQVGSLRLNNGSTGTPLSNLPNTSSNHMFEVAHWDSGSEKGSNRDATISSQWFGKDINPGTYSIKSEWVFNNNGSGINLRIKNTDTSTEKSIINDNQTGGYLLIIAIPSGGS